VVRSLPACLFAAILLTSAASRADEPRFGDRGTWAFGGDLGIGGEQGLDQGYDTRVDLELDPALDVFVAQRLSLGVGATLSSSFARLSGSSSLVAVSPRVGYALPMGRLFAFWPRLSVDLAYGTETGAGHQRILSTTLFAPIDAFVLPHLAVGIGPALTQQVVDRTDTGTAPATTTLQLLVELAGWL
jgi:hypothetical protein